MHKPAITRALYAGSFDPITRGHLDIISKALATFDFVHVAIGTNVRKSRAFPIAESLGLIRESILEAWPEASKPGEPQKGSGLIGERVEIGEYANQSLLKYSRSIGATHIVRGLREASDFNEEFNLHGVAERIDPTIPMVHFICQAQFLHVSSSTAKELHLIGEPIDWLVMPCVVRAFDRRRVAAEG
jgi:pantetheine-phosphate adenylyltransferase